MIIFSCFLAPSFSVSSVSMVSLCPFFCGFIPFKQISERGCPRNWILCFGASAEGGNLPPCLPNVYQGKTLNPLGEKGFGLFLKFCFCGVVYQMSTSKTFPAMSQDVSQKSAVFLSSISTERGVIRP